MYPSGDCAVSSLYLAAHLSDAVGTEKWTHGRFAPADESTLGAVEVPMNKLFFVLLAAIPPGHTTVIRKLEVR